MARLKKDIIYPRLKNGEGRLTDAWFIEFSVTDENSGKKIRRRISEGFSDIRTYDGRMRHAEKMILEYTQKIDSGDFGQEKSIIYNDMMLYNSQRSMNNKRVGKARMIRVLTSEFIEHKAQEVNAKTLQTYTSKLRLLCSYLEREELDKKNIEVLNNRVIVDFLKEMAIEKDLSKLTVEKYQQILYTFFKWVIEHKRIVMENPVMNIPRLGVVMDNSAPALAEGVRGMLQKKIEKEDLQLWMACCFQYYCAIRPGTELRLLRIKQINMEARTVTVRNYLAKNSRTETVDMPGQLFDMLMDMQIERYDGELYLFGKNGKPGDRPLGKNNMRIRFNKFRDQLGISSEVKYYSWKHSGAQELKRAGANIYSIQRHLRHESLTTTEKYFKKRFGGGDKQIREEFPDI